MIRIASLAHERAIETHLFYFIILVSFLFYATWYPECEAALVLVPHGKWANGLHTIAGEFRWGVILYPRFPFRVKDLMYFLDPNLIIDFPSCFSFLG